MKENSNQKVSQALKPGESCPSLDELIDLISGKSGEQRRLEAEAHSSACAHCTTELALFREFEQPTIRVEEKAGVEAIVARLRQNSPIPRTHWWKSLWKMPVLVPAAATLLAVLFLWTPGLNRSSVPKVSNSDDAMRSARMEVVGPTGTLLHAPAKLEWVAVKSAAKYQVTLSEVDRTQVWSATATATDAPLPAEVLAKVVPRKTFSWQVLAIDINGAVVADSGTRQFRVE